MFFQSVQILTGHGDGAARGAEMAHELVVASDAAGPGCAPLFGPLQPDRTRHEHVKKTYIYIIYRFTPIIVIYARDDESPVA